MEDTEHNEESLENEIKVILLGNTGVGKTSMINVATGLAFKNDEVTSTAASFSEKEIEVNKKLYKIKIWDTIGQERLRQLTRIFYNNSKVVIFVYDITDRKSFDSLPAWVKDVEEKVGNEIIKGLVGNKMDLYLNEAVNLDEAEKYAHSINAEFLAFSAKSYSAKLFKDFLDDLVKKYITKKGDGKKGRFSLSTNQTFRKKEKVCC